WKLANNGDGREQQSNRSSSHRLTTAEIPNHMPDYLGLPQRFVRQYMHTLPDTPRPRVFLNFGGV
ncbi:MAG: protein usg, partial [Alphaproteobacteria bacterium]|nr:protein usg [Alphaproteobacteria bacterium]